MAYLKIDYDSTVKPQVGETDDSLEKIDYSSETRNGSSFFFYVEGDLVASSFYVPLEFSIMYYMSADGSDGFTDSANTPSGAYLFKPKRTDQTSYKYNELITVSEKANSWV